VSGINRHALQIHDGEPDRHIPGSRRAQWVPAVTLLVCRQGLVPAGFTNEWLVAMATLIC
jgi:hypothetical protein